MKCLTALCMLVAVALLSASTVASFATSPVSRRPSSALFLADKRPPPQAAASKQKDYGESLELPESYVRCGRCHAIYAITEDDLGGRGKGCRLECNVCGHSWFQSRDRLMNIKDGFEMVPLPEGDLSRIALNIEEGKSPNFVGDLKLYVGNIAFECNEDDLLEIFKEAGDVGDVSLVRDDDGRNRGFGFITMRTAKDGEKAMELLDGKEVRGRNIAVREANN